VEVKVNRGNSHDWTPGDYKILQKLIFDASSINLSTFTLERLYGKLKIHKDYNPQAETKNALAIFLGYADWDDFKTKNPLRTKKQVQLSQPGFEHGEKNSKSEKNRKLRIGLLITTIGIFSVIIFALVSHQPTINKVNFKAVNAYGKAPHTVKFIHDLSGQKGDDFSIFVPELWYTTKLSKTQKFSLQAIVLPGWFHAYLLNGPKIIGQALLFNETSGWQANYTNYKYDHKEHTWTLPKSAASPSKGRLFTPLSFLPDSVRNVRSRYFLSYFNIRKFEVSGDNLAFETRFRNKEQGAYAHCSDIWFRLIGTNGILKMHFLTTGCTGYVDMEFGEKRVTGITEVLTPFGVNMQTWKNARLEVKDKLVTIYRDGSLIFKTRYSQSVGSIVGMEITSRINGETDYVKLYNDKRKLVYEDDFGGKVID
jgi:hypothetical protein